MQFNVRTTIIGALGLAAAFTATGLQATVIDPVDAQAYTHSAEFTAGPFRISDTGGKPNSAQRTASVVLDAFDSTLGTLTSVDIRFHSIYTLKSKVFARDSYGRYRKAKGSSRASLALNAQLVSLNGGHTSAPRSLYSSCKKTRFRATAKCQDTDHASGTIDHVFNIAGLEFDVFNAPLQIDFTAVLTADLRSCDNDHGDYCKATAAAEWWGNATVTYAYIDTPIGTAEVPEPAMLALIAAGLLGAAGARRARG